MRGTDEARARDERQGRREEQPAKGPWELQGLNSSSAYADHPAGEGSLHPLRPDSGSLVRVVVPVPESPDVGVELVARDTPGPDPAGNGPQLSCADQRANLFLGASELGRRLTDGQRCGPVHA
jgi:hypothetical protein